MRTHYKILELCFYDGRYWVLEFKDTGYPGTEELPAYFGSPIYEDKDGKLEMRRAGGSWIYPQVFGHNMSGNQVKEILDSIKRFVEFSKKMMKEHYIGSDEQLCFGSIVE